jgi:hypothetical protein
MDGDEQNKFAGGNDSDFRLKRAWAQGDYKNFSVRFGKFSMYGDDTINDTTMSGADVTIGNKNKLSGAIGGGRSTNAFDDTKDYMQGAGNLFFGDDYSASNVFYAGIDYNKAENKGFFGGVRYFRYSNAEMFRDANGSTDKNNIWQINAGYKFDRSSTLRAMYAHADADKVALPNTLAPVFSNFESRDKKAYSIEFDYKGAQAANPHTWGAWIAYRHLGWAATPAATWDVIDEGLKGWSLGANYTFAKNIIGSVKYGHNKVIGAQDVKVRQFFGRVEWLF